MSRPPDDAEDWQRACDALREPAAVIDAHGLVRAHNAAYARAAPGARDVPVVRLPLRAPSVMLCVFAAPPADLEAGLEPRLSAWVQHQDKMTSLGRMVAGIAHELNNPINFVYGNVDFVGQYLSDLVTVLDGVRTQPLPPAVATWLEAQLQAIDYAHVRDDWRPLVRAIRAGAERTAAIVRDLRVFSRAGDGERRALAMREHVDSTLTLIAPLVRGRVEIRRALPAALPTVWGNPTQLGQVLMNLLSNAAQAIDGQGWIEVTARAVPDAVEVVVCDSGVGLSEAVLAQLGEPFFTTKPVGEGTGLGMWIVASIVRAHGGQLRWGNRPGAGAEFTVAWPITPPLVEDA